MTGFNYEIVAYEDDVYGVTDPETGEWNGLVRELIDRVLRPLLTLFLLTVHVRCMGCMTGAWGA